MSTKLENRRIESLLIKILIIFGLILGFINPLVVFDLLYGDIQYVGKEKLSGGRRLPVTISASHFPSNKPESLTQCTKPYVGEAAIISEAQDAEPFMLSFNAILILLIQLSFCLVFLAHLEKRQSSQKVQDAKFQDTSRAFFHSGKRSNSHGLWIYRLFYQLVTCGETTGLRMIGTIQQLVSTTRVIILTVPKFKKFPHGGSPEGPEPPQKITAEFSRKFLR